MGSGSHVRHTHVVRSARPGFIRRAASLLQRERKTMSKKDYELIAATLRRIETLYHLDQSLAAGIRLEFANDLQRTNPRFNQSRFLDAARAAQ
jgi:hypothetical protein